MLQQSPFSKPNLTASELQAWAEQVFKPNKDWQELPLILVPPILSGLSDATEPLPLSVQTAIDTWLDAARREDECLRIERQLIPHTPILIPDTAPGRQFFKLAKGIANIPLHAGVIPKNQHQGYWFKTLHYVWQARGVVLAQRLLGVIPDPLKTGGSLSGRLPEPHLKSLQLMGAIDHACFQLMVQGEPQIKHWASQNDIPYPFESPQELLLEVFKEHFLVMWQLGPQNPEKKPLSKAQQRERLAILARLLRQSPWLENGKRQKYQEEQQQYLEYLEQAGWSGYWLLALRLCSDEQQIEPYWNSYVAALSKGKPSAADPIDWLDGHPLHRPKGKVLRPVEATIDFLGCIHWQYAAID